MTTSKNNQSIDTEQYRILLEIWQKERKTGRNEFMAFIIATAIIILVSLSGTWWPPILGIVISTIWLIVSGRSISMQERLYSEMEALSTGSDNPSLKIHTFSQEEVKVPLSFIPSKLINKYASLVFTGTPVLFIGIWIIGFVFALVTTVVNTGIS